MVGLGRVELPTSRLSGVRSNHLSYRPGELFCATADALQRLLIRKWEERETKTAALRKGSPMGHRELKCPKRTNKTPSLDEAVRFEGSSLERR
jgi:hypothetical protein